MSDSREPRTRRESTASTSATAREAGAGGRLDGGAGQDGLAPQIEAAASIAELQAAARRIDAMIETMHAEGIAVDRIAQRVGAFNLQLFARLWLIVAPAELVAGSCLLVMGSQGRGEQILKTDQDCALLLNDAVAPGDLDAVARRFNAALTAFGYPPCPGDIMLTNPLWRQPLHAFRQTLREWLAGPDERGVMQLAIFFDAVAVAGDASLLLSARAHLDELLPDNDALLARFARAAVLLDDAGPWWARLSGRRDALPLDLKKAGIFPIVHGARALSLQFRVRAPGTVERLQALAEGGRLDAGFAADLIEALHTLMSLRLDAQLRSRARGAIPDDKLVPRQLAPPARQRLQTALATVRRLRHHLRLHFRLDVM